MTTADDDRLIADYLDRLRTAASALPADRAGELVEEISNHIAEARATAPASTDLSVVRNILERLGDPAEIVHTAEEPSFTDISAGQLAAAGSEPASAAVMPAGAAAAAADGPGLPPSAPGWPGEPAAGFVPDRLALDKPPGATGLAR